MRVKTNLLSAIKKKNKLNPKPNDNGMFEILRSLKHPFWKTTDISVKFYRYTCLDNRWLHTHKLNVEMF